MELAFFSGIAANEPRERFTGMRRLNKEHTTTAQRLKKCGSKWIEKDAAKLSLFVLALEMHFIA
jgi:hypothetical protein